MCVDLNTETSPYACWKGTNRIQAFGLLAQVLIFFLCSFLAHAQETKNVTLKWDPSASTNVTGYLIFYFQDLSRASGGVVDVGQGTTYTMTNLETWVPYSFAVAAYTSDGVQSDWTMLSYTPIGSSPPNAPPTLDAIPDIVLPESSGPVQVQLTGITPGAFYEDQVVTVTAVSSNPNVLPAPTIDYNAIYDSGRITLAPIPEMVGVAMVTVTANDGATRSNQITRSFRVKVGSAALTNIVIEAEQGEITAPMKLAANQAASGAGYISTSTFGAGTALYRIFIAQSDEFYVWCRVKSPDGGSDSFFVTLDQGTEDIYDTVPGTWTEEYQWTQLNGRINGNPRRLILNSGMHTLTFRGREPNTQLDAIYVSNNPTFVPVSLSIAKSANQPDARELRFTSPAGYRYDVQASEDLKTWSTIWQTGAATTNQRFSYVDSAKTPSGLRYYRLVIQ